MDFQGITHYLSVRGAGAAEISIHFPNFGRTPPPPNKIYKQGPHPGGIHKKYNLTPTPPPPPPF